MPLFDSSPPTLISISTGRIFAMVAAARSSLSASFKESSESMPSKSSMALPALLLCRWPIKCHSASLRSCRSGNFSANSWTRFSPKTLIPACAASRIRAGSTVLLTAIRAIESGLRRTRAAARAIRARTWAIFSAIDIIEIVRAKNACRYNVRMLETATPLDSIRELIRTQSYERLRQELCEIHFSDVADMIIELPPEEEAVIFRVLPKEQAGAVFSYLPLDAQEELIHSLSGNVMLGIVDSMTPDDRVRLLEELPAEVTRRLLDSLSPEELKSARLLLGYPENSAGRYMTPE